MSEEIPNTTNEIFVYSYLGDLDKLSALISQENSNVNETDHNGCTALILACSKNHLEIVKYLLETCAADVNKSDNNLTTPLHWAAYVGNIELVTTLLNFNASIQAQDKNGIKPIHLAALRSHTKIVRFLLGDCHVHHDQTLFMDYYGITPLHLAAFAGHNEVIKVLLHCHACVDINQTDRNLITPLLLAASCNHLTTVKLLLENRARITADNFGILPIHWAAMCGNKEMLDILLAHENCYDWCDKNFFTPLFLATMYGHDELVIYLLEHGDYIDLNNGNCANYRCLTNSNDNPDTLIDNYFERLSNLPNAFHWAVAFCSLHIVKKFIRNGMDSNVTGRTANTALHTAAAFGNDEVLQYLIDEGCELNSTDLPYKSTALCWAAGHGYIEAVQILLENGADTTEALCWAAASGRLNLVQILMTKTKRSLLDEVDQYFHRSPLHWAIISYKSDQSDLEIIRMFLDLYFIIDDFENTPIHYACYGGHTDVMRCLVAKSPKMINSMNRYNEIPLTIAFQNNYDDIVEIILDCNDVPQLHRAALRGDLQTVKYLLSKNPNPNIYDNTDNLPIQYATLGNHTEIVKLLMEYKSRVDLYRNLGLPLCTACEMGNLDIVRILMPDIGAFIDEGNEFDEYGPKTPLYYALRNNHKHIFHYLLEERCETYELLHLVAQFGDVFDLEYALQFNDDINATNDYGATLLGLATTENLKFLIKLGARVTTPGTLHNQISHGSIDNVRILIEHGADINAVDEFFRTPLLVAVSYGRTDLFRWLVQNGASIEIKNDGGLELLHEIVGTNQWQMFDDLLKLRNINVNMIDPNTGITSLHIAAELGHTYMMTRLIEHGANVNICDKQNRTPLSLAACYHDYQKVKILCVRGAANVNLDRNILMYFCYDNYLIFNRRICKQLRAEDMAILELLYNAGLKFEQLNKSTDIINKIAMLKQYIEQCETATVLTLKQLCRIQCRNFYKCNYYNFVRDIQYLPTYLRKYLLYDIIN